MNLAITTEQAQIILSCLDIALKQLGLQGAQKILPIASQINDALQTKLNSESSTQ